MASRYVLHDTHFIWHEESGRELKLVAYVFDPQDAVVMAAMLNASVALAHAVLLDTNAPKTLHTWDGETSVIRDDH